MSEHVEYKEEYLPDMLPLYYNRVFPAKEFVKWISYGDKTKLLNREFSLTLLSDIYLRYMTFDSAESFAQMLIEKRPIKVDLGAIYNRPPVQTKALDVIPLEREFVIDIDMTDYDELRTCCSKTEVCNKCFKFMKIATKLLDETLRVDFGYNHMLWVFSGRRGIHCWVCDKGARALDNQPRQAIASYMNLGEMKSWQFVQRASAKMLNHYEQRIANMVKPYFHEILEEQDLLATEKGVTRLLNLVERDVKPKYQKALMSVKTTLERWEVFVQVHQSLMKEGHPKRQPNLIEYTMIDIGRPHIDAAVSHSINHLLKIPFSVHPKTGKISVPLNSKQIDKFDLDSVPNISLLVKEINDYDVVTTKQDASGDVAHKSKVADARKTSLLKSLNVFSEFIKKQQSEENLSMNW